MVVKGNLPSGGIVKCSVVFQYLKQYIFLGWSSANAFLKVRNGKLLRRNWDSYHLMRDNKYNQLGSKWSDILSREPLSPQKPQLENTPSWNASLPQLEAGCNNRLSSRHRWSLNSNNLSLCCQGENSPYIHGLGMLDLSVFYTIRSSSPSEASEQCCVR